MQEVRNRNNLHIPIYNINYIDKNSWNKINDIEHSEADKNFTRKKLVNKKDIFKRLSI